MTVHPRPSSPTSRSTRGRVPDGTTRTPVRMLAALGSLALLLPGFALVVSPTAALANGQLACASAFAPLAPALVDGKYEIASEKNLVYLSVNFDEYLSGTSGPKWLEQDYVQTKNLDLTGCLWNPIGNDIKDLGDPLFFEFSGSYDGGGRTISGLTIDPPSDDPDGDSRSRDSVGMFGTTAVGARLEGIRLVNVYISGRNDAGGLVGFNRGSIENSSVTGTVTGAARVGGLIGTNAVSSPTSSGSVANSYATATVVATDRDAGGLVGQNSTNASIINSFTTSSVSSSRDRVGGLVGRNLGTVVDSYSTGQVTGVGTAVGGLVGRNDDGTDDGIVLNSYWDTETSGLGASAAGDGKTTKAMTTFGTFDDAGWPIINGWNTLAPLASPARIWGICAGVNGGYPFLLWQFTTNPCGPAGETRTAAPPTPVLVGGSVPTVAPRDGVWQLADSSQVPLGLSSPAPNQVRYSSDGIRVTFTGGAGTSVANGLVANPNGEIVCEVCLDLAAGSVVEVWMFSTPRLVAAHLVGATPCQRFAIPVVAPLDGGGPVSAGAHTLQLALPTASGMQAVNVGVTVGGRVPTRVPAGEAPVVPAGLLAFGLLAAAGAVVAARRLVVAG